MSRTFRAVAAIVISTFSAGLLTAQSPLPEAPSRKIQDQQEQPSDRVPASSSHSEQETKAQTLEAPQASADATPSKDASEGKQTKRILWIIPNYRAVSANTKLLPLSPKGKFWLATQDSFDYSSFIVPGMVAGISQAKQSTPEFGENAYVKYCWHSFADQAVGNYFTEAIVPTVTRQDPRYYTLGHGGFFRRTGYALTRLLITQTDSGGRNFNFSEIVGNGAAKTGDRTRSQLVRATLEQYRDQL